MTNPRQFTREQLLHELRFEFRMSEKDALKAIDLAVSQGSHSIGHGWRIEFLHSSGGMFTLERISG
jgi:hypothetical protein